MRPGHPPVKHALLALVEALRSARAHPVFTVLTVLLAAGMMVTVGTTTGRSLGAEQQVLRSVDAAGVRTVVVRAEDGAGLRSDVVDRLRHIRDVEWVVALSATQDAVNVANSDGAAVPLRLVYGADAARLGIPDPSELFEPMAFGSPAAFTALGAEDAAGVTTTAGQSFAATPGVRVPDFLERFEPLLLVPRPVNPPAPVSTVVVVARDARAITATADAVQAMLAADDAAKVRIETNDQLTRLRAAIEGRLDSFSRAMIAYSLAGTGLTSGILLGGLVLLRRRDFGRRRALGATRGLIASLLLAQTAVAALLGAGLGASAAAVVLVVSGQPLPGGTFFAAVGTLVTCTCVAGAIPPAMFAARRDPLHELRTP